jgi:RNA polymerase primary sigma factor/RNA polymerase nonessential primary-like sigma factor
MEAVELYVAEVRNYPLLSRQQEIELATLYERGKAAARRLQEARHLDARDLEDRAQEDLALAVARGKQARQRLIECNLRFVVSLANRYAHAGLPLADLVQEGNIGLMEAVERYDPRRGVRFATYAGWWIKKTLLRAIASQGQAIHVPAWVRNELRHLRSADTRLETRLKRSPSLGELAQELGLSTRRIRTLQHWDRKIVSLDTPIDGATGQMLADVIPDQDTPTLDETLTRRQLQERIHAMLAHMGKKEREFLRMRFGLDGDRGQTLSQVAGALGLSLERARRLEKRALQQLRRTGALHEFR